MKYLLVFLLSFSAFATITDDERSQLRQRAMTYCSCRGGTFSIAFFVDVKAAQATCRNGEYRNFNLKEEYKVCKK